MILRRVIDHFRKQEWTAIAIDFVIVVAGVFVGIQVSNWNAARQQSLLADAYLVRFGGDLTSMDAYLEQMIAESTARYDLTIALIKAASDRNGDDDELIAAAEAFFTNGWKTPRFTIVDPVYRELTSTGNLGLIEEELRQQITSYYADLELKKEISEIARDWSLPNDSRFIMDHDVFRWDLTQAALSTAVDPAIKRQTILDARSDLARLASMFLYIESLALENYKAALSNTRKLAGIVVDADRESKE